MNFKVPPKKEDQGKADKDFSRLATTYYHRRGPVGAVMEKFNWFPGPTVNTYGADARMPSALLGQLRAPAESPAGSRSVLVSGLVGPSSPIGGDRPGHGNDGLLRPADAACSLL